MSLLILAACAGSLSTAYIISSSSVSSVTLVSGWTAVLISLALLKWLTSSGSKEAYNLDHAVLNMKPPQTLWLNMGYWKSTQDFPTACEALAKQVGEFCGLQSQDSVLDVGYGCGESVLVWNKSFGVKKVAGVTSLASHRQQAMNAIQRAEQLSMDFEADLQVGDAVAWTKAYRGDQYDKIVAVDCVYHFKSRKAFLHNAHEILHFAGSLGMTDLMLPSKPSSTLTNVLMRLICLLAGVPYSNLITAEEYEAQLRQLGYIDIEIKDITKDVFPGLARYIDGLTDNAGMAAALDMSKVREYRMFARVLRWWMNDRSLFVLVKATKGRKA